jgi:hypothetical protein
VAQGEGSIEQLSCGDDCCAAERACRLTEGEVRLLWVAVTHRGLAL